MANDAFLAIAKAIRDKMKYKRPTDTEMYDSLGPVKYSEYRDPTTRNVAIGYGVYIDNTYANYNTAIGVSYIGPPRHYHIGEYDYEYRDELWHQIFPEVSGIRLELPVGYGYDWIKPLLEQKVEQNDQQTPITNNQRREIYRRRRSS